MAVVVDDPDATVVRVPSMGRRQRGLRQAASFSSSTDSLPHSGRSLGWFNGIEPSCPTNGVTLSRVNDEYPVAVWAIHTSATAQGNAAASVAFDVYVCNDNSRVMAQGTVTLIAPTV